MAERGFVKTNGDFDGHFKSAWQIVILASKEIKEKLCKIGDGIKERHKSELEKLKADYAQAILKTVPEHLKKIKEYELQYIFRADGWFLLHCIVCLLDSGKLKVPTEGQRKALTTLICKV